MLRSLSAGALVVALGLSSLASCSSDEPDIEVDAAAVDALCSDFDWDAEADLTANEDRMREVVQNAAGEGIELGPVLTKAQDQCADVVADYFEAVSADDQPGNLDTPTPQEDLENEELTAQLEEQGVSRTEVLLLGSVMDATGVEDGGEEGSPMGVAQRRTVEAIELCRAVAAGERSYDDVTQFYVDEGAKPGQAKQVTTYLESAFCDLVT